MTSGPIKRFKDAIGMNPRKGRRKKKKKGKGSKFRDYRGVDGVLEDAQK